MHIFFFIFNNKEKIMNIEKMEKNQQKIDVNDTDISKKINDLKTTLIDHYGELKNKIDLRVQKILINIEKDEYKQDETLAKKYQSIIMNLNIEFSCEIFHQCFLTCIK